jgi:hypothetical protein
MIGSDRRVAFEFISVPWLAALGRGFGGEN